MDRFQNKYRIPSSRLQNWDYCWAGAYFITICTKDRKNYFGNITNGEMQLSGAGILGNVFWYEIKNHAKNVELGAFVVMPNHVHGILILNGENGNDNNNVIDIGNGNDMGIVVGNVETGHALSLQPQPSQQTEKTIGQQRFQNIGKNTVSSIIGSYKSAVTKHANRLGFALKWQERFYDHIIRNDGEYQRITQYIITNPLKWGEDKFYSGKD
ncbi:MAG: transposase [Bacteroidales bacterium]|nr:transposase [Bacteroidales bacterium]